MTRKRYLTWTQFDEAVVYLAREMFKVSGPVSGVYGPPRGGLPLAVALSHALDKPLLLEPALRMIWVDDIVDTGKTLEAVKDAAACCAWFSRRPRYDVTMAALCKGDEWLVFPWESVAAVAADEADYQRRRA